MKSNPIPKGYAELTARLRFMLRSDLAERYPLAAAVWTEATDAIESLQRGRDALGAALQELVLLHTIECECYLFWNIHEKDAHAKMVDVAMDKARAALQATELAGAEK